MQQAVHGWRRKMGVAMLLIACMCMALWIRSMSSVDTLVLRTGGRNLIAFKSGYEGILAMYVVDDEHRLYANGSIYREESNPTFSFGPNRDKWRWQGLGCEVGQGEQEHSTDVAYLSPAGQTCFRLCSGSRAMAYVGVPQSGLTLFPTILAAIFLLSKSAKPAAIST